MAHSPIKILFFADTHLGFDLPLNPRVQRRRRGDDFFSNYHLILENALARQVDLVIHGGDLFFRSKIPPAILDRAYVPLAKVAQAGIPVYLVPGNHERSRLPGHLWLGHPHIHVFTRPTTFHQQVRDTTITLSGFPFARRVKGRFQDLLDQTGYAQDKGEIHFLCLHQTFEGATVGVHEYTFRESPDNIPGAEIPEGITAVLSGHIHRGQQLDHDLAGRPLPAPVLYPGSIERTSFAERCEKKYYVILEIDPGADPPVLEVEYHPLPARPMVKLDIPAGNKTTREIIALIRQSVAALDPQSVVRVSFNGLGKEKIPGGISTPLLRELAPSTMNISLGSRWDTAGDD